MPLRLVHIVDRIKELLNMRTPPSGPFGTPQIFSVVSTVSVNISVSNDWTAIANSAPGTWVQETISPNAPFSIDDESGDISYLSGEIRRVLFSYSYSLFPLAANDILVEGTLDINGQLVGTQNLDTFSQQMSLLGAGANGFPFNMTGFKIVTLAPQAIIRPIFANTVNTDNFIFEKAQIMACIVD